LFVALILCFVNKEAYTLVQGTVSNLKKMLTGFRTVQQKDEAFPVTESHEIPHSDTFQIAEPSLNSEVIRR
jgi:hypothetical protein